MDAQPGIVTRIEAGQAVVAVAAQGGCGACSKRSGCGIGKLASPTRRSELRVDAAPGLQAGDRVDVRVDPAGLLSAAALGYLFPAALVVAGAITGDGLARDTTYADATAALGALLGLGIGIVAPRWLTRRWPRLVLRTTVSPAMAPSRRAARRETP